MVDPDAVDQAFRSRRFKEDDDFLRELDKMVADSVDSRKYEHVRSNVPPAHTFSSRGLLTGAGSSESHIEFRRNPAEDEEFLVFKLMTRGGAGKDKPQAREILVPADTDIAVSTIEAEKAEREEQANLKRIVMQSLERDEKETAMMAAAQNTVWGLKARERENDSHDGHAIETPAGAPAAYPPLVSAPAAAPAVNRSSTKPRNPNTKVRPQGWGTSDIMQLEADVTGARIPAALANPPPSNRGGTEVAERAGSCLLVCYL